jgi:hypothetical protein
MTQDDLDFYCSRLRCHMPERDCIDRQRKAYRMRQAVKRGQRYDEMLYGIALFCLSCKDGANLRKRLHERLTPKPQPIIVEKPKPNGKAKAKLKSKPKPKPKAAPKPPERVPVPLAERPLCVECGRWVVYSKGLCRACYNRRRREEKRA